MKAVSSVALRPHFIQERIDLVFRRGETDLRGFPTRFWRALVDEAGSKTGSALKAEGTVDAYVFGQSDLFVFDDRVVIKSCRPQVCLDGALALLWRTPQAKLERLIYQTHELPRADRERFRASLLRLRSEAGDRLGPAVVSQETVLFHPKPHCRRLDENRVCFQIQMRRISSKAVNSFLSSSVLRRRKALDSLGFSSIFGATAKQTISESPALVWAMTQGSSYATLRVWSVGESAFANFEFDGQSHGELDSVIARLLSTLAPRDFAVEAIHCHDPLALPEIPGAIWEPHPLGSVEMRSVLVGGETTRLSQIETVS